MDIPRQLEAGTQSPEVTEVIEVEVIAVEAEDSTSNSPAFLKQIRLAARQKLSEGKQSVNAAALNLKKVGEAAHTTSESLAVVGKDKWETVKDKTQEQSQQRLQWAKQFIPAGITSLGQSTVAIADAFKDVPTEFFELMNEMPKVARRMQRAGVRPKDGIFRSDADAMALFNKIPGADKLNANQENIRRFLSTRDGSHIRSRQQGGGIGADNIVWELKAANRARGAKVMTMEEQVKIAFRNGAESLTRNSKTILGISARAAGTAALIQALVTALSYTLDLHRGDITQKEFAEKITLAAVSAGLATPVFVILFIVVTAMCPAVVPLLSAPLVVAAFNGLLGISIVTPIAQSLARHTKAGGFGDDAKTRLDDLSSDAKTHIKNSIAKGEETVENTAHEMEHWWGTLLSRKRSSAEDATVTPEAS